MHRFTALCGVTSLCLLIPVDAPRAQALARNPHQLKIYKAERKMELWIGDTRVRTFRVGLGGAPHGDKRQEGDQKTPEGQFYVAWKNPKSSFHRFLGLSYPMPRHARRAYAQGQIGKKVLRQVERAAKNKTKPPQFTGLGGLIGIHGGGGQSDWTLGCIAVTDDEITWLYSRIRMGDRVEVLP